VPGAGGGRWLWVGGQTAEGFHLDSRGGGEALPLGQARGWAANIGDRIAGSVPMAMFLIE
jgi:hypothetical protein